ncbi:lysine-sensitive aspartokinase III [Escherichia coli]|uniref:Aspartokinase n=1 Tax=Escherichia coli TaxID=562 RepID=A0A484Y9V9_ECOLX|nr:lysine-sensitive aspartokinase III [Escherichia coli]
MSEIVVSKFGGTSVADFDAMNRSADIVLSDANVRLVVLSASAGITNLLVALAEGLEPGERFEKLDAIRNIQFAILERLRYPNVIREEIERLLENITVLAEAAALATSPALTDELVSHGELMSTLLFVEILRERDVQAQWFDVRKVMRTNDRFGRAEPDVAALAELAALQLLPRLNEGLVITQGFIGSENKGRTTTLGRGGSDYTAALLAEALHASRVDIWTDVPGIYTNRSTRWFPQQNALMKSRLPKRQRWQLLVQKYCIRQRCYPQYAAISQSLSAPAKTHAQVVRWCAIKLKIRRCSARWRFVAIRLCSLCTA